jgi:predicted membrane protein
MNISLAIVIVTVLVYIPLAAILLYVWTKHGRGEPKVILARTIFLIGSFMVFAYMVTR